MPRFSNPHHRADSAPIKLEEGKYIIYPRALDITWGGDERYWKLSPKEKSVAELKQVCWLEVTGSTDENLRIGETYNVGFKVSLAPDAFGWDECNVYIMAKIGRRGKFVFKQVCLNDGPTGEFIIPNDGGLKIQVEKPTHIHDPNASDDLDLELYFGMYEVWTNRWKGGLKIHYAFVEKV